MNSAFQILGGLSTIFSIFFFIIAILAPIWLFCIYRNTGRSKAELCEINQNLQALLKKLELNPATQPSIPSGPTKRPGPGQTSMSCPHCGRMFAYDKSEAGLIEICPGCNKEITLL